MKQPSQLPLVGKHEPSLGKLEVKGKADAVKRQSDKLTEVCAEVYRLTGQKITQDDPILVAALFQSELIHRAGGDVAAVFQETVTKAITMLADAVKEERQQAANLDKSVALAFQQIADGAKKAGDGELAGMQARFARVATETLENVRRESLRVSPAAFWWKIGAAVGLGSVLGLGAGVMTTKSLALQLNSEQARLIHNGMLLDEAWPKLTKQAREAFGAAPKPSQDAAGSGAKK
jgi:hypothetical protein